MAWNGSGNGTGTPAASPRKPVAKKGGSPLFKGLLAGLIVVVGALAIALYIMPREKPAASEQTERPSKKIKDVKPPKIVRKNVEAKSEKQVKPEVVEKKNFPYDPEKWQEVDGHIIPKGARLVNNYLTNKVERTFKYSTDEVILGYIQVPEDGMMPPPHPIMPSSEKTFLKSLDDPIEILDTDSEKVRAQKEQVIIARAQIKERMDAGESFEEILSDHYKLMSENNKIRRDAQKELDEIYKRGDIEGANKYKLIIDTALSQMGVEALDDPDRKQLRKQQRKLLNEQQQ